MKKLCILGNSHTGSLKRAWNKLKESDLGNKFEITFFADRGDLLKNLTAENEYLKSDNTRLKRSLSFTSGGLTQIDTNEYDFFLIYGSQLWPYWLYEDAFYSLDFITLSIDKHLEKTQAKHLMAELRKATTKPIFLGHNPILTQHSGCTQFTNNSYNVGMDALNFYLSKKYNTQAIKQPKSTLEEGNICYTEISFLNNSKRLAIGFDNDNEVHPGDDLIHMNDDFGKIWIKHFLEKNHL